MYYKQLDGLRFIAAFSVIIQHISPITGVDFFGYFGVNLFFVISGFLITEILMKQKEENKSLFSTLKVFFIRRSLRIFPLYYLYILICYLIVPVQTTKFMVWLLTYGINFWIVVNDHLTFWFFTHLWSLSVEEQFYIFWPFLILLFPVKRYKQLFIVMIFLAVFFRLMSTSFMDGFHLFNIVMLPTALDCFGIGALLAYLKRFGPNTLESILKRSYILFIIAILYFINSEFGTTITYEGFGRVLIAIMAFFLVGLASANRFKGGISIILENKIIVYLGKISYGLYVYHLLIWGLFGRYFARFWSHFNLPDSNPFIPKSVLEMLFITICTILVSIISYELFEKHFLKLKKYVTYKKG